MAPNHFLKVVLLILVAFPFPFQVLAEGMDPARKLISQEQFQAALESLNQVSVKSKAHGAMRNYLMGVCQSRLGKYPEAIRLFTTAIKENVAALDAWYEIGQALYANNELNRARQAFEKSIQNKFKTDVSHYYIAHISQVLEEYQLAETHYAAITKDPKADPALKQVSKFQWTEVKLQQADTQPDPREWVKNVILPSYEEALNMNTKSDVAGDIRKKVSDLKVKYRLDPNLFVNGRPIPKKRHVLQLSQKITYDNNMTLATDLPSKVAAQRDSYIFLTTTDANYNFFYDQRHGFNPGVTANWVKHSDQDSSTVFTNDGWDANFFLRNRLEHTAGGKQATMNYNLEYEYMARDKLGKHEVGFFNRAISFSIGEAINYFSFGVTSLSIKYRTASSYLAASDNDSTSVTLMQTYMRKNNDLMIFLIVRSMNKLPNNTNGNTDSTLFNFNYIIPEVLPRFILNMGASLNMLDTKAQKATRGTEKTFTPSLKLTRRAGEHLRTTIFYNYTKNSSQDKNNFDYDKQQYGFEINYLF